ncbi:hypothetical protein LOK82_00005 [Xylella fastidiosa subsp. multiplex]|uniref:Uncharacterized protein n=1 Tax=Xylella fastidiosa subsp. multiplex TaxID=644357 RepID=A0AAW6HS42_XYLFS|nr:hypothetical protein [Xylella fastidiosa subsp. multiplex]
MASHLGVWTTLPDAASDDRPGAWSPMSAVKIIRPADPNTWKALAQRLHAMAQRCVVVAFLRRRTPGRKTGSARLDCWRCMNWVRQRGIPERSVVRRSISEHQDNYVALHRQHLRAVLRDAMSVETALDTSGRWPQAMSRPPSVTRTYRR